MEDAIPQGVPGGGQQTGHENTTIRVRRLLISAGVLVAMVVVSQLVLALWMGGFKAEERKLEALHPGRQDIDVGEFPQPRLQESPPVELVQMMREERERVASYGWVNRKAGVARIPVDRAMEILAKKGLPRVPAPPPTPDAPPNTSIPPAGKREQAGPAENQPAPQRKEDQPRPAPKQGGKP